MNLIKATGTIGGLTLVSRIAGFAREMLMVWKNSSCVESLPAMN